MKTQIPQIFWICLTTPETVTSQNQPIFLKNEPKINQNQGKKLLLTTTRGHFDYWKDLKKKNIQHSALIEGAEVVDVV